MAHRTPAIEQRSRTDIRRQRAGPLRTAVSGMDDALWRCAIPDFDFTLSGSIILVLSLCVVLCLFACSAIGSRLSRAQRLQDRDHDRTADCVHQADARYCRCYRDCFWGVCRAIRGIPATAGNPAEYVHDDTIVRPN